MSVWTLASGPVLAAFGAACVLAMLPALGSGGAPDPNRLAVAVGPHQATRIAAETRAVTPGASVSIARGDQAQNVAAELDGQVDPSLDIVAARVTGPRQRAEVTAAFLADVPGTQPLGTGPRREQADVVGALGLGAAVCLVLTALLAGAGTALSTTGGVLDRRRELAALRLAGVPVGGLSRALRAEVTLPTTLGTVGAAAVGVLLAQAVLHLAHESIRGSAWSTIVVAVAIAAALPWLAALLVRPVLMRNTGLNAVRS